MNTKQKMIHAVEELPADASIEDGMERFLYLAKVERGLKEANDDKTVSHAEVRERMGKWLK